MLATVSVSFAGQDLGKYLHPAPDRTLVVPRQPGASSSGKQQSDRNQGDSTKTIPRVWFESCWTAKDVIPYEWRRVSGPDFVWFASIERFCINGRAKRWDSEFNIEEMRKYGNDVWNFRQSTASDIAGDTVRIHLTSNYTEMIPIWARFEVTDRDEISCVKQDEVLACEGHTVSWCSGNPRIGCDGAIWVDSKWRAIMRRE